MHHSPCCRSVCAAFLVAVFAAILPGCAEPVPPMTDAEFHANAHQRETELFGTGTNGWDELVAAIERHRDAVQAIDEPYTDDPDFTQWPSMQVEAIYFDRFPREGLDRGLTLLESLEADGLFTSMETALASPTLYMPWDESLAVEEGFNETTSLHGSTRGIHRNLRAHMRLSASRGNSQAVIRDFRTQLALARATASRCLAIDYIVGATALTITLEEARFLAVEQQLAPESIRAMLETLDAGLPLPPVQSVLDAERDFCLVTTPNTTIPGTGQTWEQAVNAAHAEAVAHLESPARAKLATESLVQFALSNLDENASDTTGLMLDAFRSSLAQILDLERRLRFDLAGTRAVLRVALHHAATGTYPESLEGLNAPTDPVSGKPFVYRPTPGEEAPFLLYSVGADGIDNNGVEQPEPTWDRIGPDEPGYDCRFTNPRRPYPDDEQ